MGLWLSNNWWTIKPTGLFKGAIHLAHFSKGTLSSIFFYDCYFLSFYTPLTCGLKRGVNSLQFKELLQAEPNVEKQTCFGACLLSTLQTILAQITVVEFAPVSRISCLFDSADFKLICHLRDLASRVNITKPQFSSLDWKVKFTSFYKKIPPRSICDSPRESTASHQTRSVTHL